VQFHLTGSLLKAAGFGKHRQGLVKLLNCRHILALFCQAIAEHADNCKFDHFYYIFNQKLCAKTQEEQATQEKIVDPVEGLPTQVINSIVQQQPFESIDHANNRHNSTTV
jgi:hypothetical protein